MSPVSQQASSVEVAIKIIAGAAQKPGATERAYLVERLRDAATTLRNLQFEQTGT